MKAALLSKGKKAKAESKEVTIDFSKQDETFCLMDWLESIDLGAHVGQLY